MKTEIFKELRYLIIISAAIIIAGCGEEARDTNMLKQQGAAAFESKNFTGAINLCREGLKAKPSDRDFLYYLGVSYSKLDLYDSAMIYIRRAKVLYPHDRDINKQLVQLCPMFQDFDCALRAIAVLILTGDNEKMYWPQLAEFNYRNDELLLAVKYYKLTLADNPDIPNYYLYLSIALGQMGKHEEAIDYLNRSIDRFGPSEESYANMGTLYINLQRFDKAEECFRSSLALNPDNISIWINLANILTTFDDREKNLEGLEIYKKYREQTPEMYNLDSLIRAIEAELGQ